MRLTALDRLRIIALLIGVVGLLALQLFAPLFSEGSERESVKLGLSLCWFAAVYVAAWRWHFFRCPSCGERFLKASSGSETAKGVFRSVFSNRCICCGYDLPLT